jgi:hypothetical protein
MHRSIGLVVAVVSACGPRTPVGPRSAEGSAPTAQKPSLPSSSSACTEQVARLGSELHDLAAAQPGFLPLVQGIKAPVTSTAQPVDRRGIVVAVTRDGEIVRDGGKLATTGELRDYLEHAHRRALEDTSMDGGTRADATVPLYIWADAATPIRTVAAVAAAVEPAPEIPTQSKPTPEEEQARKQVIEEARAAGILGSGSGEQSPAFTVRLIVTSPDSPSQPAMAAPSVPASEPDATRRLVDQLRTAIGTCGPISAVFATASAEGVPAKQAEKFVTDLPKGLQSCDCKVADLDALTSGLHTWFGAWAPALRWIELPKLDATDKRPISKLVAR